MTAKREVVRAVFEGRKPPYVPWDFGFTKEAYDKLARHFGRDKAHDPLGNHFFGVGGGAGWEDLGNGRHRDSFGTVWNRSVDKDIGVLEGFVLPEPTLENYTFPDPFAARGFKTFPELIQKNSDRWIVYNIGFSLYERAWALRGMENLMMDFYEHPDFARELLRAIADHNLVQVREAVKLDIDAVYFGDDWGQQTGLQMGPRLWHEFIYPELKRMYGAVREAGKYVMIHSCGKVDELLDSLCGIGLNCFNPFQPEVMDVERVFNQYKGRLVFHGGLSTQKTLPYGTTEDVRAECRRLLDMGRNGGYIFAPAHAVEGDVPLENMLAFIECVQNQT